MTLGVREGEKELVLCFVFCFHLPGTTTCARSRKTSLLKKRDEHNSRSYPSDCRDYIIALFRFGDRCFCSATVIGGGLSAHSQPKTSFCCHGYT